MRIRHIIDIEEEYNQRERDMIEAQKRDALLKSIIRELVLSGVLFFGILMIILLAMRLA